MATSFVETTYAQDLEITEFDYRYCRADDVLAAGQGTAGQVIPAGTLLDGAEGARTLAPDALSTAPTTSVLLETVTSDGTNATSIVTLARGPAVLTDELLVNDDGTGISALQIADLLAVSPPIIIMPASTEKIIGQPPTV